MKKTPSSRSSDASNRRAPARDSQSDARRFGDKAKPAAGKSYGDKPRADKPYGDKPYSDKPKAFGDKPKPYGDKPKSYGDKPYGDKSFSDKARGDKPYAPRAAGGEKSYGDKTYSDKTYSDKPRTERFNPARRDGKAASFAQAYERPDAALDDSDEPVPLSAAGFVWGDVYRVWREFSQPLDMPFVDRFLKQVFKSRYSRFDMQLSEQLKITKIFNQGVVFLQLATYLQQSFEAGSALDIEAFDKNFVSADARALPHQDYWYWIGLRTGTDVSDYTVRDRAARQAHFNDFAAHAQAALQSPAGLLWFGLRPKYQAQIRQRAEASNWSDAQIETFIRGQAESLPLWLRPQTQAPLEMLVKNLVSDGVNAELVDGVIRVDGGRGITHTALYKAGAIEIQDRSSQQIAAAVTAEPGQKVWDACAGAGGKTLAIASRLNNKGVVVATDLYEDKLQELKRRAKRAEIFNLRNFVWDASAPLRLPQEVAKQKGFDWILLDVPCTATGTWRRNADARWRLQGAQTTELVKLQRKIARAALPALRDNGHLVYATCSWLVDENESQVLWLLREFPELSLVSQTLLGSPDNVADTMFVAVLARTPKAAE